MGSVIPILEHTTSDSVGPDQVKEGAAVDAAEEDNWWEEMVQLQTAVLAV